MADVAELVWEIDSSQARGAARDLSVLNKTLTEAANATAKFGTSQRAANGQFSAAQRLNEKNRKDVEALAHAYNPVLSAQIRYRDEALRTSLAVKAGVITEQQRIAILKNTRAELDGTAAALRKKAAEEQRSAAATRVFAESQQVATHHATNLSYQLNDIGMMMAMGQNPFMLMMQQGPQVAQIFSTMSAEGRKLGPTLASSFRMFLNPTTAVTLALIGGSAALVQWGMSALGAGEKAKTAADRVDDLKSAYQSLSDSQDRNRLSLNSQIETYGRYWQSIRLVNEAILERQKLEAEAAARDAVRALGIDPNAITAMENTITHFMAQRDDMSAQSRQIAIDALGYSQEAIQQYGLQYSELLRLNDIQQQLKDNDLGIDASNRLIAEMIDLLDKGAQNGAALKDEMSAAARTAGEVAEVATRVQASLENADRAMKSFSSSASGASLSHLVSQASALAANMWDAVNASNSIGAPKAVGAWGGVVEAAANAWNQALDRADQVQRSGLGQRPGRRSFALSERAMYGPESDGGGGGGGGADRALAQAEKGFQNIRELLEKESLFQVAEWEKRQKQLDVALQKDLITRQNYELMKSQLQAFYFGSEYQKNQLQYDMNLQQLTAAKEAELITEQQFLMQRAQLQRDYYSNAIGVNQNSTAQMLSNMAADFGQMNQLAGGGYDKLLRAQKAFAAGSAVINAYLAATQALADPSVPFWGKFAAYAKVLAAGLGAVNAIKGAGSGGGGGGASSSSAAAQTQTRQEPTRTVLVNLTGDDWLVNMAESIMTQIYDASKDGRVIVRRDR